MENPNFHGRRKLLTPRCQYAGGRIPLMSNMHDLFEGELSHLQAKLSSRCNWIAVASADHARRGRDAKLGDLQCGFMQVCHGKRSAVSRVQPGDRVAYYSPTTEMGGKDKLQSFVSMGMAQPTEPYAFDMGGGFVPWRRDVSYVAAREAAIAPLIEKFEFVEDPKRWGYKFRFGLFKISDHDMLLIARAMRADLASLSFA